MYKIYDRPRISGMLKTVELPNIFLVVSQPSNPCLEIRGELDSSEHLCGSRSNLCAWGHVTRSDLLHRPCFLVLLRAPVRRPDVQDVHGGDHPKKINK